MPVVGTAGHVDHGKSTLVEALTGRDPDRWAEEKRRGLTIDLGFSWMTLTNGTELSFVDVPGHQKFARNMLAGLDNIDLALLVVAADEGWMPQTEEHVAVLDLLGIERGVVALTKADRVDATVVVDVTAEVEHRLVGTSLEGSTVVPVSATAGVGLDDLVSTMTDALSPVSPKDRGRPRLWVDRSFTVAGVGTVVTGTLVDGGLRSGDKIMVWPAEVESRIRSIQTHERPVEQASPGRRVAVGMVGVDRRSVVRGHMIGLPGQWVPTDRFVADLRPARYVEQLTEKGAFQLHIGTGALTAQVRMLDSGLALFRLSKPLCVRLGDRYILRDLGRSLVIAGGRVLDPSPRDGPELRRSLPELAEILDKPPNEQARDLLAIRRRDTLQRIAAHTGGGHPTGAVEAEGLALSDEMASELIARAERLVSEHHVENPLTAGVARATLASQLEVTLAILRLLIDRSPALVDVGDMVGKLDHRPTLTEEEVMAWENARNRLADAGLAVPAIGELGLTPNLLRYLEEQGHLTRISPDIVLLPQQIEQLIAILRSLEPRFTVSVFRTAAGISRKYAVPFLEWADRHDLTRRDGDSRTTRNGGGGRESNPPGAVQTPHRF